jgi:ADP-ribose pyrophosphatase
VPESERHQREHEERDMARAWVDLSEARDLVLAGRLHNPTTVCGVLAAAAAREAGWATLRPADAPWPERSPGRG